MEACREVSVAWTLVYVSPRMSGAPDVPLVKCGKYHIPLPPMSKAMVEEGDLLGYIPILRYQDYNLQDPEKFPQFQSDKYMCQRPDLITLVEVIVPQEWIEKLASSGLLNLLRIPIFSIIYKNRVVPVQFLFQLPWASALLSFDLLGQVSRRVILIQLQPTPIHQGWKHFTIHLH